MNDTARANVRRMLRHEAAAAHVMPHMRKAVAALSEGRVPWPAKMAIALSVDDLHSDCLATLFSFAVVAENGRNDERTLASLLASICFLVRARHGIAL